MTVVNIHWDDAPVELLGQPTPTRRLTATIESNDGIRVRSSWHQDYNPGQRDEAEQGLRDKIADYLLERQHSLDQEQRLVEIAGKPLGHPYGYGDVT